ncbi:MAG: LLM class F420-dependent oxidoreductase [Actinomycetota bacterium]
MKFGLTGFPLGQMGVRLDGSSFDIVTRLARAADDLGFDFVSAQDHTVAPRTWAAEGGGEMWFEPFTVLAVAASATSRVRLLTDVLILPYRSPFAVAKSAATLDDLSGGRMILGVGAGYLEQEFEILDASFPDRGPRTDEAIDAIKHAWTNEWLSFTGTFYAAKDVAVRPRPVQQPHPPIWVGGNSMRALRRAVEHADGWDPFRAPPDRVVEALARARDLGLGDRPFDVCVPLRRGVYLQDKQQLDLDSIRRQRDQYAQAGATHLKVGFRGPSIDEYLRAMEQFARAILG